MISIFGICDRETGVYQVAKNCACAHVRTFHSKCVDYDVKKRGRHEKQSARMLKTDNYMVAYERMKRLNRL